jgi:Tfp pilus tip-associated adhesin PilY1
MDSIRNLTSRIVAPSALALAMAVTAHAAPDDISSTPVPVATAATVKPNVMLLMDTSESMSWTHMPDQVESVTRTTSVGYKSSQCNALYYDPAKKYPLPRNADKSPFATPVWPNAPYAGYGHLYVVPDATPPVDLSTSFRAYDNATLQVPGFPDTPQPAYYYRHSSGAKLPYDGADCRTPDTGISRNSNGSGTWTKVVVSATSGLAPDVDERSNFAIWYAYYRTRLAMTKSATSLAFTPLTDTYRVGFITVQPMQTTPANGINPDKYIAISDFDATQRSLWFSKMFSQTPFGASPAREGLARVGRHYAGKNDLINNGMTPDPLQHSCQQNFTIMTTDGYWNTQTETPNAAGLFGGPLREDGTTRIVQADGDYTGPLPVAGRDCPESNPYCARPIFDGAVGTETTEKNAWNQYDKIDCGQNSFDKTLFRPERKRTQVTKSFTHVPRTTEYWTTTRQQDTATDTQIFRKSWKWKMTTEQFVVTRHRDIKDQYQIFRSVLQSRRSSEQMLERSTQAQGRTYRIEKTVARERKQSVQNVRTQRQWLETRQQAMLEKRRFFLERQQVSKRAFYYATKEKARETYEPALACGPAATHDCRVEVVTPPEIVDPMSCPLGANQATATTQSSSYPFVITECSAAAGSTPRTAVANCTVQDTVGPGPTFVRTICEDVQEVAPVPVAMPCSNSIDGTNLRSVCTFPAGPNNIATPGGASCTGDPTATLPYTVNNGSSAPYVKVSCSYAVNTVDNPATCSAGGTAGGVYTACANPAPTNYDIWVQPGTCATTPTLPGQTITCGPGIDTQFPTAAVDATTCTFTGWVGSAPNQYYQTCATVYTGPYPNLTPLQTCTASNGTSPPYENTECVYDAATNYPDRAVPLSPSCVNQTAAAPNWREVVCTPVVTLNQPVAPSTCVANPGTSPPYTRVTCDERQVLVAETATPQDPAVCPVGERVLPGPNFEIERCRAQPYTSQTGVPCTNSVGPGPQFIVTVCGNVDEVFAVQDCSAWGGIGPNSNNAGDTWTCDRPAGPNNASNVAVATCTDVTPTAPNWLRVTCAYTETFASAAEDPAACAAAQASPGPELVQTTCTPTTYATAFVRDCASTVVAPTAPQWITRTCSNTAGPNNDPTERRGQVCSPGISWEAGEVKVTCRHYGPTVDYVATPALCNAQPLAAPSWTQVSCGSVATSRPDQLAGACTGGPNVDYLNENTACSGVTTLENFVNAAPCTTGVVGNEFHECREVALGGPVDDPSCMNGTLPGSPWTVTKCAPRTDSGKQLVTRVKRSTTVTLLSGTTVIGTPSVSESFTGWTPSGTCVADFVVTPETRLAAPPPDFSPCTTWPCVTSRDPGFKGSHDSLADVANYYYKTDLRTTGPFAANDVKPKGLGVEDDFARHQHMTTFVVGLGVSGSLTYQDDYKTSATGHFAELRTGARNWPIWPDPLVDYTNTDNYNNPKSIDDFWHTAVNGRGQYFSANDPNGVVAGLSGALLTISEQGGSGGADAASSFQPSGTNNAVFVSSYRTVAWSGDLQRFTIDPSSGLLSNSATWSAQTRLTQMVKPACDNRKVLLIRPGGQYDTTAGTNLVNFAWDSYTCNGSVPDQLIGYGLNGTEKAAFAQSVAIAPLHQATYLPTAMPPAQAASAAGAPLVNFLRGQTQHEDYVQGGSKHFRKRTGPLGDIINSTPVYVGAPFATYQDTGYAGFISANANRAPTVYVGGNDGMLHAFDAATGDERWAVIPQAVLPNLFQLASTDYKNNHRYFVDGSPIVGDVWNGTAWRTILVGGLNAGGKSYYALDITDPAAPKALWEFGAWSPSAACPSTTGSTSDCNVGLTFGKPVITKIAGQWVVLFTSGYKNADGKGYLYAVDATSGALVNKITVDSGSPSPSDPIGLAQINNFVDNTFVDNTTIRAYGGDLKGNIWRFEFPGFTKELLGTATDGTNPQPITTRPEIAEVGNKPIVFVGTGKLLHANDVTATPPQRQSIYGIVDPLTAGPVHTNLRTALKPLTFTQTGSGATAARTVKCTAGPLVCQRSTGWFMDLPEAGERVNVDMQLLFGTLVVASNVPNGAACEEGGHSWFNYFDYLTGEPVAGAPVNPLDPSSGNPSTYLGNALVTGFNIYRLIGANNTPFYQPSVRMSDTTGRTPGPIYPAPDPKGKRISWREIVR